MSGLVESLLGAATPPAPDAGGLSETVIAALLTAAGAAGGAGLSFLAKRRVSSGTVQTTEARDLWAEASAFRKMLHDENVALRAENVAKDEEIDKRDEIIVVLRKENAELWADKLKTARSRGAQQ